MFKEDHTLKERLLESAKILKKYPGRIPVIVETAKKSTLPKLDKKKYLVPDDLTIAQFVHVIRKRIKLEKDKALFLLINNSLQTQSNLIKQVYNKEKDEDNFLYVIISSESTFGV